MKNRNNDSTFRNQKIIPLKEPPYLLNPPLHRHMAPEQRSVLLAPIFHPHNWPLGLTCAYHKLKLILHDRGCSGSACRQAEEKMLCRWLTRLNGCLAVIGCGDPTVSGFCPVCATLRGTACSVIQDWISRLVRRGELKYYSIYD
jgi:hypothetical protein